MAQPRKGAEPERTSLTSATPLVIQQQPMRRHAGRPRVHATGTHHALRRQRLALVEGIHAHIAAIGLHRPLAR